MSQLSKPQEFDDPNKILGEARAPVFHTRGEHDMLDEGAGQAFSTATARDRAATAGAASPFRVHFVGLVNVKELKAGGMGRLGGDQLAWLAKDLAGLSASTPVVVFTHIPLWTVYADWGWGTDDAGQALALLRRFGSVTAMNGHIHQALTRPRATSCATPRAQPAGFCSLHPHMTGEVVVTGL